MGKSSIWWLTTVVEKWDDERLLVSGLLAVCCDDVTEMMKLHGEPVLVHGVGAENRSQVFKVAVKLMSILPIVMAIAGVTGDHYKKRLDNV